MTQCFPANGARYRQRSKRLTMIVAAGAIALAGLAAGSRPAQANVDDLLRFLAGAVIVGAIVNAIDDNQTPNYVGRWQLPDECLETVRVNWQDIQVYNARCLRRAGYSNMPDRCERNFRINGQNRRGYVAECMWAAGYGRPGGHAAPPGYYHNPDAPPEYLPRVTPPQGSYTNPGYAGQLLPSRCETTYRQNGERRNGYWGHCLRNAGFTNLPRNCRLQTTDGQAIYNRWCLTNAGYRRRP